mgnify:CR=1 FL=1
MRHAVPVQANRCTTKGNKMNITIDIKKPSKVVISQSDLVKFSHHDYIFQEKMDGEFSAMTVDKTVLLGENMRGEFVAFDMAFSDGRDVRGIPFYERLQLAIIVCGQSGIKMAPCGDNADQLFSHVMQSGGEGIVLKHRLSKYGEPMYSVKRIQTFICRVGAVVAGKSSANIYDATTGQARGKVMLRGKVDHVRYGSTIKVEGFGLTKNGMIREPRPDAREWLLQY